VTHHIVKNLTALVNFAKTYCYTCLFSDVNLSQCSVVMFLRLGGIL